jgi:hypothetical protein
MSDMLSPFVELRANNVRIKNLFSRLDIWLSRKEPADIAEFTMKTGLPELSLAKDVPMELWMGYDPANTWRVFSGYVTEPRSPRYLCKDEATKLLKTQIIKTFLGVTAQDVILYGLRIAGVNHYVLDSKQTPMKTRFVAAGENVSDLVKRVNATWGLENDHYFDGDRRFHWDPPVPQPGPVYSYQYGKNIIDLEFFTDREPAGLRPAGGTTGAGKLLTVASPFIKHSSEIEIIWPEVKSTRYLVETVHHFLTDAGTLRTEIYFREMPEAA